MAGKSGGLLGTGIVVLTLAAAACGYDSTSNPTGPGYRDSTPNPTGPGYSTARPAEKGRAPDLQRNW